MTDDNWAKNLADRKKQELEGTRIQQEKDLSDRKMLNSHADPMWVEVRKELDKAVKEFNAQMESEFISYHAASAHDRIVLEINRDTHTIVFLPASWTLMGLSSAYKLAVVAGNGVVWKHENGNTFAAQLIARNEVTAAINKKNY
jgi:hypothetical protein